MVDGRSPEQIDRVLGRWQRLLSGLDADTRLYFYMLRRPVSPEAADDESSGIVAVSQRKRSAFLAGRVQQLKAYLVWSRDPRLRAVADGPTSGRASRLMQPQQPVDRVQPRADLLPNTVLDLHAIRCGVASEDGEHWQAGSISVHGFERQQRIPIEPLHVVHDE